ncbi:MAG TPA: DNA-3-methyladenine glycosylase 2 family protein [Magnetospirillaceae bacterium]|jgi:DNA-3-methyladenine glycosylase II
MASIKPVTKIKAAKAGKLSRAHHAKAIAVLKGDERLATIITTIGAYEPSPPGDGFCALVRAIASQQVSKYASDAILARLYALFPAGQPDAYGLLKFRTPKLAGVGLSRRKVDYLRDLARHVADGRIVFDELPHLPDEEVIERLTAVKGIGRWTAEMYLLFTLGRPDVLPLGDVALVNVVRELYELPEDADHTHFGAIAESWRPWRSVAVWYLYRSINLQRAAAKEAAKLAKRAAAVA